MGPSASQRCAGRGGTRRRGAAPNAVPEIRGRGTGRGDALPDPALARAPAHPSVLESPRCWAGGEQKSGSAPRAPAAGRGGTPEAVWTQVGTPRGRGPARARGAQWHLRACRGRCGGVAGDGGRRSRSRARLLRAMAPAPVLSGLLSAGEHVGDTARPRPARSLPGTWGGGGAGGRARHESALRSLRRCLAQAAPAARPQGGDPGADPTERQDAGKRRGPRRRRARGQQR